jgi:putative transposase
MTPEKKTWGRKRTVLVDTQGTLLAVHVGTANASDAQAAKCLCEPLVGAFPRVELLYGDSHYAGEMSWWIRFHLGWVVQVLRRRKAPKRGLLVEEGEQVDWDALFPPGFQPLPKRWVVERTFAWFGRFRRLARDYEGLPASSEAFLKLAAIHRILVRLASLFSI